MKKIKLSVGTSFEIENLDLFNELNKKYNETCVYEVYGSMQSDPLGSVRERYRLPKLSFDELATYVIKAKEYGIELNYTMNSLLIDQVYLEENHKEIDTFLGNLKDIGVVNLTIASPLLFYYIKQSFPDFKLQISTVTNVLSIQQARYWNAIGASRIILSEWVTRKFKLLKNIRLAVDCELELLANEYCVSFCSDRSCHYIIQSMTNRENKAIEYKHLDKFRYVTKYPYSICFPYMCRDGIHNLNSNWIRPEDLKYYSSIGYDIFKIVGRTYPKQTVKLIVEAYMKQRYDGNFYDLGPFYSSKENKEKNKSIFSGLYIDNRNLDGFIKYIIDKDIHCDEQCGIDCFYCKEFFEQIMEKQLLSEKSNIE